MWVIKVFSGDRRRPYGPGQSGHRAVPDPTAATRRRSCLTWRPPITAGQRHVRRSETPHGASAAPSGTGSAGTETRAGAPGEPVAPALDEHQVKRTNRHLNRDHALLLDGDEHGVSLGV